MWVGEMDNPFLFCFRLLKLLEVKIPSLLQITKIGDEK